MTRVRDFQVRLQASRELLAHHPEARAIIRDDLIEAAKADLRGPRGGRYVAVGEPYGFDDAQTDEDFMRNTHTFIARVRGRYVRPVR